MDNANSTLTIKPIYQVEISDNGEQMIIMDDIDCLYLINTYIDKGSTKIELEDLEDGVLGQSITDWVCMLCDFYELIPTDIEESLNHDLSTDYAFFDHVIGVAKSKETVENFDYDFEVIVHNVLTYGRDGLYGGKSSFSEEDTEQAWTLMCRAVAGGVTN